MEANDTYPTTGQEGTGRIEEQGLTRDESLVGFATALTIAAHVTPPPAAVVALVVALAFTGLALATVLKRLSRRVRGGSGRAA